MRPKGSKVELEVRRKLAVKQLLRGKKASEVARDFEVSPSSVSRWKKAYEEEGWEGLKAKPHPGRKPKITEDRYPQLEKLLLRGAKAHGYYNDLWTLGRVAEVIEKHFGVSLHPSNVWVLLHRMGWSSQKPERVAKEKDEEEIERWRKEEWPRIKKTKNRGKVHGVH